TGEMAVLIAAHRDPLVYFRSVSPDKAIQSRAFIAKPTKQGLKRAHERRSIHDHRFSQLHHRQARSATQHTENAELCGGETGIRKVALVEPGDVPCCLSDSEEIV